jgi:hypothetical protein
MSFKGGTEEVDKRCGSEIVYGPVYWRIGAESPSVLEEWDQLHTTSSNISCMFDVPGNNITIDTRVR